MAAMLVTALRLRSHPPLEDVLEPYLLHLPAVRHLARLNALELRAPVTFLVGDNGAGKSTLVEALALALGFDATGGPLGGFDPTRKPRRTGTESALHRQLVVRTAAPILRGFYLRSETHFDLVRDADDATAKAGRNTLDPRSRLQQRSHGESILDLVAEHVHGEGIYLLDEPEAGLSVIRQMALLAEIHHAAGRGAQFVIATHSPILPAVPGAQIVEINEAGLTPASFEDLESVAATREFLADPAGTARYLVE